MPRLPCPRGRAQHGRVCLLVAVGWMAMGLGELFPAEAFRNVSVVDAHGESMDEGAMGAVVPVLAPSAFWEDIAAAATSLAGQCGVEPCSAYSVSDKVGAVGPNGRRAAPPRPGRPR